MTEINALEITPELSIPLSELEYRASRSGGPGGQHVNTSSTRVEVWWDVAGSAAPTADQRERLLQKLATRLDSNGRLRLVSADQKSVEKPRRSNGAAPGCGCRGAGAAQEAKADQAHSGGKGGPARSQAPAGRNQAGAPRSPA